MNGWVAKFEKEKKKSKILLDFFKLIEFKYLKYFINCKSCAVGRGPGCFDIKRVVASCNGAGIFVSNCCTLSSNCNEIVKISFILFSSILD